ncbi:hypothetical protein P4O66_010165 [Electrophorus voltai]|uniref:Uncharacterized protein n=1 Tax=Electrophorus voltai TaxID=2609070 RepID=A0AAD8Z8F3_9TELE|nr:hypothetical protein P4O66_010165 [Electrophorus voltai]
MVDDAQPVHVLVPPDLSDPPPVAAVPLEMPDPLPAPAVPLDLACPAPICLLLPPPCISRHFHPGHRSSFVAFCCLLVLPPDPFVVFSLFLSSILFLVLMLFFLFMLLLPFLPLFVLPMSAPLVAPVSVSATLVCLFRFCLGYIFSVFCSCVLASFVCFCSFCSCFWSVYS